MFKFFQLQQHYLALCSTLYSTFSSPPNMKLFSIVAAACVVGANAYTLPEEVKYVQELAKSSPEELVQHIQDSPLAAVFQGYQPSASEAVVSFSGDSSVPVSYSCLHCGVSALHRLPSPPPPVPSLPPPPPHPPSPLLSFSHNLQTVVAHGMGDSCFNPGMKQITADIGTHVGEFLRFE